MDRARATAALVLASLLAAGTTSCEKTSDHSTSGTISVTSPTIPAGGKIPPIHAMTPHGQNVSPALHWSGIPPETKEIVVIVDDPDAGELPFSHWVVYGIPPTAKGLPENIPPDVATTNGVVQGKNDFHRLGWGGPDPPEGKPHRYSFWVYALAKPLHLKPGEERAYVLSEFHGKVLATGRMIATYGR